MLQMRSAVGCLVPKEHYDPGICNDTHVKDEVTIGSRQTGLGPLS